MSSTHRLATRADTDRALRSDDGQILALAPKKMLTAEAEAWAATLTVAGMEQKIRELEIWVAEVNHAVAAWGAIQGDKLERLYTDPAFAGRGIGTRLLGLLEALMRGRNIAEVHAEASSNAEQFYLRRGYEPAGVRTPEGAQLISKRL